MKNPHVSVLMTVYNGEKFLKDAVESILNQTYSNFEFVIVDDNSTDGTFHILEQYSKRDKRINLIRNSDRIGFIRSLNKGLSVAQGEYIARMDADDVSLPNRLELQLKFLEDHPEIGLCGTWIKVITEKRGHYFIKNPTSPFLIRWRLLFNDCIVHPSVMIHKKLLDQEGGYATEALYAEDYDLWIRLNKKTLFSNISDILYLYRIHGENISLKKDMEQEQKSIAVSKKAISGFLGKNVPLSSIEKLRRATRFEILEKTDLQSVINIIEDLYQVFIENNILNQHEKKEVAEDVANNLITIGFKHVKIWPFDAIQIMYKAIRLDKRILIKYFTNKLKVKINKKYKYNISCGLVEAMSSQ